VIDRKEELNKAIQALKVGWFAVENEIDARLKSLTETLIASENSETRGRIKALVDLKDFPNQLESELRGIELELTHEASNS
jgi:hypothetical protein